MPVRDERHIPRRDENVRPPFRDENVTTKLPPKHDDAFGSTGVEVPFGWILLMALDPPIKLLVTLGPDQPSVGGSYGGWQQQPRPRRRPLTWWQGTDGKQAVLSLMFDKFAADLSVEREVHNLERLATVNHPDTEPPRIIWDSGGAAPHDYTNDPHIEWVIAGIEWGDAAWSESGHFRTRQAATITLFEYIEDEHVEDLKPPTHKRKKDKVHKYRVRKGDTLRKIAAKFLGTSKRWHEIAKLNHIRDPNNLKVGSLIKIPPKHKKKK